jgi:hypothetical protein
MNVGAPVPLINQPENFLAMPGWRQAHVKAFKPEQIHLYADTPPDLWGAGDSVGDIEIQRGHIVIRQSLYLIAVQDIEFHRNAHDKRRVSFVYNGQDYDLSSTCPSYDKYEVGEMIANGYICVSLGEDYRGAHYKIVATIFGVQA